ncbi:hypothetical protein IWX90DRAFT_449215, partial [Phyllosticta citrichinensis]
GFLFISGSRRRLKNGHTWGCSVKSSWTGHGAHGALILLLYIFPLQSGTFQKVVGSKSARNTWGVALEIPLVSLRTDWQSHWSKEGVHTE